MRVVALLLLITTCFLWHANAQNPICPGNQIWSDCGSACNSTCDNPYPICTLQCVPRCECPSGAPIWHNDQCVQQNECPGTVAQYPDCCNATEDTWCLTCEAPNDNCCIAAAEHKKCNANETCYHRTDANGRSQRGCIHRDLCPPTPGTCEHNDEQCFECLCDDPVLDSYTESHGVSFCREPGWVNPWCCTLVKGDPHIQTYDGIHYSLINTYCCHVLTRDECIDGLPVLSPNFIVVICLEPSHNVNRGWVLKGITVIFSSTNLVLEDSIDNVRVNGNIVPIPDYPETVELTSGITATYYRRFNIICIKIWITSSWHVVIYFDFGGAMGLWIPNDPHFKGKLCGLAGDSDGFPGNDLIFGPSVDKDGRCPQLKPSTLDKYKPGKHVGKYDMLKFGMSWYYQHNLSKQCEAICNGTGPIMM